MIQDIYLSPFDNVAILPDRVASIFFNDLEDIRYNKTLRKVFYIKLLDINKTDTNILAQFVYNRLKDMY